MQGRLFFGFPDVRKIGSLAGKLGNHEPIEGHYLTENTQPLSKKSAGNRNEKTEREQIWKTR
jgi:hypothetical protein